MLERSNPSIHFFETKKHSGRADIETLKLIVRNGRAIQPVRPFDGTQDKLRFSDGGSFTRSMAGAEGFEPPIIGPKPIALPLGHAPKSQNNFSKIAITLNFFFENYASSSTGRLDPPCCITSLYESTTFSSIIRRVSGFKG